MFLNTTSKECFLVLLSNQRFTRIQKVGGVCIYLFIFDMSGQEDRGGFKLVISVLLGIVSVD